MKTIDDFKDYYNDRYIKTIELYQKTHNNLLKNEKSKLKTMLFIFGLLLFVLIFPAKIYKNIFLFSLYIIIELVLLYFIYKKQILLISKTIHFDINKMVYSDMIRFITEDKNIKFDSNSRVSKKYFETSYLFNLDKYNYNGENYTECIFNNEKVIISDFYIYNYKYHTIEDYITENGKTYKRTINRKIPNKLYTGCYIELPFPQNINSYIYLVSNNFKSIIKGRIDKFLIYNGERIILENLVLEEKYNVYSNDENTARYILDLPNMEKIVTIEKFIKENKNIVYRPDHKISVFIENFTIENILKQKISFEEDKISYNYLEKFFKQINNIFSSITILQDNNK